jgi:hypothetical protein
VWPLAGDLLFLARLQLVSRFARSSAIGHSIFRAIGQLSPIKIASLPLIWKIKVKIISVCFTSESS